MIDGLSFVHFALGKIPHTQPVYREQPPMLIRYAPTSGLHKVIIRAELLPNIVRILPHQNER